MDKQTVVVECNRNCPCCKTSRQLLVLPETMQDTPWVGCPVCKFSIIESNLYDPERVALVADIYQAYLLGKSSESEEYAKLLTAMES